MRTSRTPIGIDSSGRRINAVQLSRAGRCWRLAASMSITRAEYDRPFDAAEATRLVSVLERKGFTGRDIVVTVPPSKLLTALLEVPPKESGAPLDQITRVELAAAHKCEPQQIESAYWELPESMKRKGGASALAVGCRQSDANELLDTFEGAGFVVRALDVGSCALARVLGEMATFESELAVFLDVNWTGANVGVMLGDVIVYERLLPASGIGRLHDELVDQLGLDGDVIDYLLMEVGLDERGDGDQTQKELLDSVREHILGFVNDLVSDMKPAVAYVTQEYGRENADHLHVVGEVTLIPGFTDQLAKLCGLPAAVPALREILGVDRDDFQPAVLATAIGLAQHPAKWRPG